MLSFDVTVDSVDVHLSDVTFASCFMYFPFYRVIVWIPGELRYFRSMAENLSTRPLPPSGCFFYETFLAILVDGGHLAHLSLQQHLRFGIFYDQWSGCWCSYARFSLWNSNGTHPTLREKGVECDRFCCIVVTAVLNVFLFRVFSFPRFAFLPRQRFLGF